jgi:hypothetical protein
MSSRPIAETLRHIGAGAFIDQASDQLAELVAAVDERGKGGSLTLQITIKKASRGGAMNVTGKITVKKPAEELMEALLFATPEGNLVADDPHQQKLDLKIAGEKSAGADKLKTA